MRSGTRVGALGPYSSSSVKGSTKEAFDGAWTTRRKLWTLRSGRKRRRHADKSGREKLQNTIIWQLRHWQEASSAQRGLASSLGCCSPAATAITWEAYLPRHRRDLRAVSACSNHCNILRQLTHPCMLHHYGHKFAYLLTALSRLDNKP